MYVMMSRCVVERSSIYTSMFLYKDVLLIFISVLCNIEKFQVSANYLSTNELYLQFINSSLEYPMKIVNNLTGINWQYTSDNKNLTIIPTVIPICCLPDYILKSSMCQKYPDVIVKKLELPHVYNENFELSKINTNSYKRRYGNPCVHGSYALNSQPPDNDVYYLLENGTIYENNSMHDIADEWLNIGDYCLTNIIDDNNEIQSVVAVCLPPEQENKKIRNMYPIAMALSIPFLAITFIIYAFLPELRNIHGLTLMVYVGSLFIAYLALIVVQFGNETIINAKILCTTLADCSIESLKILNDTEFMKFNFTEMPINQQNFNSIINYNHEDKIKCPCLNKICIPICCPHGYRVFKKKCIPIIQNGNNIDWKKIDFPYIYDYDNEKFKLLNNLYFNYNNLTNNPEYYNDYIYIFIRDPCIGKLKTRLNPLKKIQDKFMLLKNGDIIKINKNIIHLSDYCLSIIDGKTYSVVLCINSIGKKNNNTKIIDNSRLKLIHRLLCRTKIISLPFLFITLIIYTIIPELNNMHGITLRYYISFLFIAYLSLSIIEITPIEYISDKFCFAIAFIIHFSFLSSFFWLNVMCFDIWWTFGGFRGLQGTIKQRERKKFIIYSIYAWGCASFFTGICLIMDLVPQIPNHFIRPQFGIESCWFKTDAAKAIYFYAPMGVTIVCNITLFISTALKIIQHKKDTAHHLKGIDSRRHDDNKQWFNLYLKLFIVMGINWSMEIISWLFKNAPEYVWYLSDLTNTLQGVIIFIIFVWKDKIKRLLLKRLGFGAPAMTQSRNSSKSGGFNSNSTSKVMVPLRDRNSLNFNVEQNRFATTITDDGDVENCI